MIGARTCRQSNDPTTTVNQIENSREFNRVADDAFFETCRHQANLVLRWTSRIWPDSGNNVVGGP